MNFGFDPIEVRMELFGEMRAIGRRTVAGIERHGPSESCVLGLPSAD